VKASRSTPRRPIDGVLLLDKPRGITSQAAVSRAKSLLGAAKAGHTGTLDPMATGLLPLVFGEATKFAQGLLEADKSYRAHMRLGLTTTTGDLEGEVVARAAVAVDRPRIEAALAAFRGEIVQTPPMYSALKHAGKALYTYARAGVEIAREPRRVSIAALELERFEGEELTVSVSCSKGTYIRVLAEDIGRALGCGATLSALERTRVGTFTLADALDLERLAATDFGARAALLLPVDALVRHLPRLDLDTGQAGRILHGSTVEHGCASPAGVWRIYGPDGSFLGLAEARSAGQLAPFRLMAARPAPGSTVQLRKHGLSE
jgi:tRNA pseudouridine55 synthase